MNKIALIYSFNTKKTSIIAGKILEKFGSDLIDPINAEEIDEKTFLSYDNLILGVPTWFDGELPNYWDEFVPALEEMDLTGKKIAIFGLGDQVGYPENFLDAVGIMADLLQSRGATIVGFTSSEGYTFEHSRALRNGKFCGLAIDFENQHQLTDDRINQWIDQLRKEFGIDKS
ncbi:MAG TPA: flavodoxin [Bacteroidales bacterium]|nr:flavodoxin [Bacteroidales bacterium]HQH40930.1 flavodoxin [Bacteroidales bacterium]